MTSFGNRVLLDNRLSGALSNPADKVFFFFLPLVEVLVALVVAIHHAGLARLQDLAHKGTFIRFAGGEKELFRYGPV